MTAAEHRSGKSHRDENFPVASLLIEKRFRAPILAFYDFVRAADDVADHPTLTPLEKLALLARLESGLDGTNDEDLEAVILRRELNARDLTDRHARDLLLAFRHDVTKSRYHSFDELMAYCSLSAMPVGRFVLDLHGESRATWPASDAICAALQIINHLQDCGKDYVTLDRAYLPEHQLLREGADLADLAGKRMSLPLRRVVDDLLARTRTLLDAGAALPLQIANRRLALEIGVIHRLALRILERLHHGDPLVGNVHLRRHEVLATSIVAAASTFRRRQKGATLQQHSGEKA
jgi:squalene synthase HpnC